MSTRQKTWITTKDIRESLNVGRTTSYEIAKEIARGSNEPDAVLKRARLLRVREDLFDQWIVENGYKPDDPTA